MYSPLPKNLHIKDSRVAGQGLFAKKDIHIGEILGVSHLIVNEEILRTPLGGFINHSDNPNLVKWLENDRYFIKTIQTIKSGEELFLKYTFYNV